MRRTGTRKGAVLELNKLRDEDFSVYRPLCPARKFGQVLFFYFRPDVERRCFDVQVDQPDTITVIR